MQYREKCYCKHNVAYLGKQTPQSLIWLRNGNVTTFLKYELQRRLKNHVLDFVNQSSSLPIHIILHTHRFYVWVTSSRLKYVFLFIYLPVLFRPYLSKINFSIILPSTRLTSNIFSAGFSTKIPYFSSLNYLLPAMHKLQNLVAVIDVRQGCHLTRYFLCVN